jgi:hypothetical protein
VRLGENTRALVGMYSSGASLADCLYSYFLCLENNYLHLFLHVEVNLHWTSICSTRVYCINTLNQKMLRDDILCLWSYMQILSFNLLMPEHVLCV